MPIPRLHRDRTALLVIDVQERLLPTIHHGEAVATNCGLLLDVAARLGMPAIVTEQYVKGLGRSVEPIASRLTPSVTVVEKTRFSAAVPGVMQALDRASAGTVLVCGVEAHVCVLQSTLDLLAAGRQVVLVHDAISSGDKTQVAPAFHRLCTAGAVTSGVLGAAYELLGDASDPAFRDILAIVKRIPSRESL
jgi:nicotinamidase-related amidase